MERLHLFYYGRSLVSTGFCLRRASSGVIAQVHDLDKNIKLQKSAVEYHLDQENKPLVVLFGWLLAKPKHLSKYTNIYCSKGLDVLTVQVTPFQVLWSQQAQDVVDNIVRIVEDERHKTQPILVHGFSVGGYMYGELLVKLQKQPKMYAALRDRLVGQVFDSPVDFEGIPRGFSKVLSKNAVLQALIQSLLEMYLKIFKENSRCYFQASRAFHNNDLNIPSLLFYSYADPIGIASVIEKAIKLWLQRGVLTYSKVWNDTSHVSHMLKYPDEYVETLLNFLDKVGILNEDQSKATKHEKEVIVAGH